MDLKLKDVAELLHVSETTIKRWLSEGKIPFYEMNNQYRFSRNEIENWVLGKKASQDKTKPPMNHTCEVNDEDIPVKGGVKQFGLYRSIHKGAVLADVPGSTKEELIRNTMKTAAESLDLDADVITELLLDREALQPTGLGNGIGIPHTRDFLLNANHDVVLVVYPKNPIPYGSLDGKDVHTLFFLFACDDKRHLHLLAKIAHLSSQAASSQLLHTKPSKEKLLDYIKDWEGGINALIK